MTCREEPDHRLVAKPWPPPADTETDTITTTLEVRDTHHPVRDFLIVVNLLITIVVLAGLGFLVWAIIAGATYPPGELPAVNAPVMPHPGDTQ
jgi:hypothetical protein